MKLKKYFNNFVSVFYWKRPFKENIVVDYDRSKFKQKIKEYLSNKETKSNPLDIQQILSTLYTKDSINYKIILEDNPEEQEKIKQVNKIMEKSNEQEEKINSLFINDFSLSILENSK